MPSQSHTTSRVGSSKAIDPDDDGDPDDDLYFDLEANLVANDATTLEPCAPRHHSYRSTYPPSQVQVDAHTSEVDDSIDETYL